MAPRDSAAHRPSGVPGAAPPGCGFVPPYLLRRVAESGVIDAAPTLDRDLGFRASRTGPARPTPERLLQEGRWTVHDAGGGTELPGRPVRTAGARATGDAAVDEAAVGVEAALEAYRSGFDRDSYDGAGAPVSLTVHYGQRYANAFWDGSQLVFGDGDGTVFDRFTRPVDVLAHELAHALVQHTCGLEYHGQPGALNESVADAMASCLKQRVLGQDAARGDWLIGQGIFLPGVSARALRDMAAPGTAYDDPRLGRDPQVGHMDDFVVTDEDNGGVHLNSGIPNRAFQLAATAVGGDSLQGAGRIWYAALTGGRVGPTTDFVGFAAATVAAAGEHEAAVVHAWAEVGVAVERPGPSTPPGSTPPEPSTPPGSTPPSAPPARPRQLRMVRSGGFAGLREVYDVDLEADEPTAREVREALHVVEAEDSLTAPGTADHSSADRFTYTFAVAGRSPVTLAEQHLDDPLRALVDAVLRCGRT